MRADSLIQQPARFCETAPTSLNRLTPMQNNSASESGFSNPRLCAALVLCAIGALLGFASIAQPGGSESAKPIAAAAATTPQNRSARAAATARRLNPILTVRRVLASYGLATAPQLMRSAAGGAGATSAPVQPLTPLIGGGVNA